MNTQETMKYYRNEVYGLTQKQVANELHMSVENYKKLEQGITRLKFDFILDFINILSKHKIKDSSKPYHPISFYDFLFKSDYEMKPQYSIIEQALNNASKYPKYIDRRLFDDCYDYTQPMYRILYSYEDYKEFLTDFHKEIEKYRELNNTKLQNEKYKTKENLDAFSKEYIEPLDKQRLVIRYMVNKFIDKFLIFYCDLIKKPTKK